MMALSLDRDGNDGGTLLIVAGWNAVIVVIFHGNCISISDELMVVVWFGRIVLFTSCGHKIILLQ